MASLRYAAKFDPFLSLDCAPTPSTLVQSKNLVTVLAVISYVISPNGFSPERPRASLIVHQFFLRLQSVMEVDGQRVHVRNSGGKVTLNDSKRDNTGTTQAC